MSLINPFQLLEINIISAQDLAPASRKMRTYAVAWVHPTRKLSTRVDSHGHNNPTWNDKFVFRVEDDFLRADTSAVMVEIYAVHWLRDVHVGTVRVLVGNLIPPPSRPHQHHAHIGMRFVALQVRRPSGRPQGILNIGVALLDSSMRSMPLYRQLSTSAVGYRHLMGEEGHRHHQNNNNDSSNNNNQPRPLKPILRRSHSERSERERKPPAIDESSQKASSIINGSELRAQQKGKGTHSRASSLINGSEVGATQKGKKGTRSRTGSIIAGSELGDTTKKKDKNVKAKSIINGSESGDRPKKEKNGKSVAIIEASEVVDPPKGKVTIEEPILKFTGSEFGPLQKGPVINGNTFSKIHGYEFGGGSKVNLAKGSMWSESDVGPSPSEVAAAVAKDNYKVDEGSSSVVGGWSLDGSVEGLRSKLERWRTELPPLYDRGDYGSFRSSAGHVRRHTDGGGGLFSCFGNVYGYECSCICGKPTTSKKDSSGRAHRSPSMDSMNFL